MKKRYYPIMGNPTGVGPYTVKVWGFSFYFYFYVYNVYLFYKVYLTNIITM